MVDRREGGDVSVTGSQHTVSAEDFQRLSDRVAVQGRQFADFMSHMTMRMSTLAHTVSTATTSTSVLPAFEAHVVTIDDMQLSAIAPVGVLVDTTPVLTENYRKRNRGRRLKRMSDGASSSGLEIQVTIAVPYIHVSPLAPAMISRLHSMFSVVIAPPIIVPDFASQSSSIVQPLHQFQQAKGRRDRYALG
ncbi:hypothetical protein Scep_019478 [Stephania cephalantha]|uniref:Uncharacterized protein n=1 Tax=Stephania cephalantha TaxID=152367 RepID=A0AAP0IAU7_9MAGN